MDGVALFSGLVSLTLTIVFGFPLVSVALLLNLTASCLAVGARADGPPPFRLRWLWPVAPFVLLPGLLAWGAVFNYDAWEPDGSPAWAGPVVWLAVFVPPILGAWLAWSQPGTRWFLLSLSAFQTWLVFSAALVAFESASGCWL
jgi:hypothetical protein